MRAVFAIASLLVLHSPASAQAVDIRIFFELTSEDSAQRDAAAEDILATWEDSNVVMLLELFDFLPPSVQASILGLLARGTGEAHGTDLDAWWRWIWKTDPGVHPDYAEFKSVLYGVLDPSFTDYFDESPATSIRLDEIRWGSVHRDGIPPLDRPALVVARDARYLDDDNVVFGVALSGQARAYPKRILAWHEMVKDTLAGEHFTGVYCTLCGSMILYRSTVDGVHHELGTSGFLYRSNKLMYDHASRSLWSTLTGGPVVGPLVGTGVELEPLYVVTTTWGEWRRRHPDTMVLSLETGYDRDYGEGVAYHDYFGTDELMFAVPETDDRLRNKAEVLALRFPEAPDEQLAISVALLATTPVHQDALGPVDFVVLTDPSGASRVYAAEGHRFGRWDGGGVAWDVDGGRWTVRESGLTGPDGTRLARLPAHRAFWFGWYAQFPQTRLIR